MTARHIWTPDFAEIWTEGNTTPTTLNTVNIWEKFEGFTDAGQARGAVVDLENNRIVFARPGIYHVTGSFSFSGGNSKDYEIEALYINGAPEHKHNLHTERKLNANGDIGACSISGLLSAVAGSAVEIAIRCTDGTNDPTIRDINLTVVQIAE